MGMSGWIAWRRMPPELVMGASLLIGHHQSLSGLQALVPHRQGTSLAAKMVCGPALVQPGAWPGHRKGSSESPEGGSGLPGRPRGRMVACQGLLVERQLAGVAIAQLDPLGEA
jgi:hypothetical protein